MISALGQSEKTEYNKRGDIVAQIDAAGNKTRFILDKRGQRFATIQPKPSENESSPIYRQFYNVAGQLTGSVSPDGIVTSYLYDKFGRNDSVYAGVLKESPSAVKNGNASFSFNNLLPNDDFIIFVSWKKSLVPTKTSVAITYILFALDNSFF
ncbi:MAG: RHS repeat protein [Planctomycetaceae bacterium]|jgi:YD repeat-containing protein|nr:RHS repeat protein [Planctomycetaceae bacterium]